ncbi:MAG: peptidoglycan recognition family protein [Lachnospiraceae bacterium]
MGIKYKRKKIRNTKKKNGKSQNVKIYAVIGAIILVVLMIVLTICKIFSMGPFASKEYTERKGSAIDASRPEMDVQLLTVNEYSRPGTASEKINGIVIHYTANPGATAQQNRNYFEGLKTSKQTKVSSHFIIGLEGEIIQCVPTWEMAYASNKRNLDTVSIECCHPDSEGKFTDATYQSMVQMTAWLCQKFDLNEKDVIRHYDVTGKNCPKYFVENEDAWKQFKKDVKNALEKAKQR